MLRNLVLTWCILFTSASEDSQTTNRTISAPELPIEIIFTCRNVLVHVLSSLGLGGVGGCPFHVAVGVSMFPSLQLCPCVQPHAFMLLTEDRFSPRDQTVAVRTDEVSVCCSAL